MQTSSASKTVGTIVALTGLLGIVILAADKILPLVPMHYYALVVFVIVDFLVAGYVFMKPAKMSYMIAAGWSLLRIIIQIADVSQASAPGIGMGYADFASYLFNPIGATPPNPMGIPGALIDLIILLEIVAFWLAWGARSSTK
jgi:hypothetical protein